MQKYRSLFSLRIPTKQGCNRKKENSPGFFQKIKPGVWFANVAPMRVRHFDRFLQHKTGYTTGVVQPVEYLDGKALMEQ